jgi:hypothetical protein
MASTEKMNIDLIATDKASGPIKKVRGEIDKVATSAKITAKEARNLTRGLGNAGRGAGQAGIQIQQFVGQVTAGTNPMVAFSQQSADLGFVLGFPLLGAVVGIAAAIGSVLVPALFEAEQKFADFNKRIKSLTADYKLLNDVTRQELIRKQTEVVQESKKGFDEQAAAIAKTRQALSILESNLQRTGQIAYQKDIDRTNKKLGEQITKFAELELVYLAEKRNLNELTNAVRSAADERERLANIPTANLSIPAEAVKVSNLELEKEAAILRERVKPAMQKYFDEKVRFQNLQAEGLLTDKEVIDLLKQTSLQLGLTKEATFEVTESMKQMNDAFKQAGDRGIKTLEDGLVNLINGTTSAKDAFRSMAKSIIDDLIRMQIRASITGPLMRGLSGFFGGAPSSPIPVKDLSSPAGSLPSFAGGGYTGMSGRSGGIDGKGGFPAILHPNETVVDHTQGQGSGGVIINQTVQISTGVSQTVRAEIAQLMPQIAAVTKQAVADSRRRGGSFAAAFGG